MKIRAHHLLCIQGFQGHGYSAEFAENMSEITRFLKSYPQQKIEIIDECDIICKCCPHNKNGKCKNIISNWMIKKIDRRVINKMGIDTGAQKRVGDVFSITNKVFRSKKDLNPICGNCSWKEKCLWYLSRSK
jgi:uncharacterized protein